jgi:competence protein ComEA
MFKKFVAALLALIAATAFAAVDANKASQADLEAIKGIGPVISTLIITERKKGDYKDWNDLVTRVKGVGDRSAAKFSEGGLTVNGQAYAGAPEKAAPAKATVGAKAASGAAKVAEVTKATASKAASAVKSGAEKAASGVKAGAKVVKGDVVEQKDAFKENAADAKAKRAEKKAEKADAASAPAKK